MLCLTSLSLSIHAAEHFGAEGLRALCNLRVLQLVDLAHIASNEPMSGHTAGEMLRTLRVWPKLQGLVISGAKLRFRTLVPVPHLPFSANDAGYARADGCDACTGLN